MDAEEERKVKMGEGLEASFHDYKVMLGLSTCLSVSNQAPSTPSPLQKKSYCQGSSERTRDTNLVPTFLPSDLRVICTTTVNKSWAPKVMRSVMSAPSIKAKQSDAKYGSIR